MAMKKEMCSSENHEPGADASQGKSRYGGNSHSG